MNSRIAKYLLAAINPTIHYQVGDIERLPVPSERSAKIDDLVAQCVELVRQDSRESETTYDFIRPLRTIADRSARKEQLAALEAEIDAEVSRLYGLTEEDLAAIDRELSPAAAGADEDMEEDADAGNEEGETEVAGDLSPDDWARSWISYAFGTVLGRFEIGKRGGLGCGDFHEASAAAIRKLIDPDGIMPCEAGHPEDIAARTVACLELMLEVAEARQAIRTATGSAGDPVEALRGWLDRFTGAPDKSFWKYHHQLYRKRPVYWPFQSPKRRFTIWLFHERLTQDTLFVIRRIVDDRLNLLERQIADLRKSAAGGDRRAGKELDNQLEFSDDLREFSERLKEVISRGYTPHIDDGVLLDAAPLHPLLPSWPETRATWQELEQCKYDWAQQAMEYWPQRVKEACRTNKSFAIAHGLA